jgi:hypothetical protein
VNPEDKRRRIKQVVDEIGKPLLEKAIADIDAYLKSQTCIVEEKWAVLLDKLYETEDLSILVPLLKVPDEMRPHLAATKDPSVLPPLLDVPDDVRPHFEEALKSRRQGRPSIPSYLPMSLTDATAELAATFVRYLKVHGKPEDQAIELMTLIYDEVTPNKLRDVLSGKSSSVRSLKKRRRARARETVE